MEVNEASKLGIYLQPVCLYKGSAGTNCDAPPSDVLLGEYFTAVISNVYLHQHDNKGGQTGLSYSKIMNKTVASNEGGAAQSPELSLRELVWNNLGTE